MKTIWKYELEMKDEQSILMPEGFEILTVQTQHDIPCLWAKVDPESPEKSVLIKTNGTGHDIGIHSDPGKYAGTYQVANGRLVFHVFVVSE